MIREVTIECGRDQPPSMKEQFTTIQSILPITMFHSHFIQSLSEVFIEAKMMIQ